MKKYSLKWKYQYNINFDPIDNQHRSFFEMIESFLSKIDHSDAFNVLHANHRKLIITELNNLKSYAQNHFHMEEKIMLEIKYPKVIEHKIIHNDLYIEILKMENRFLQGNLNISIMLEKFLAQWWVKHILEEDVKFKPYLDQQFAEVL